MKGILIDKETGDLLIEHGAVATGDPEAQTAEAVVLAMRGEFKEYPLIGGEAVRQLAGGVDVMWPADVREMLQACGVTCTNVAIDNVTVTIS